MNVYTWGNSDEAIWLEIPDPRDLSLVMAGFRGAPMEAQWCPPRVRRVLRWEDGRALRETEVSTLAFVHPALSQSAVDKVGDFLRRFGELLPLECDEGEYYAYNVTNMVDALNEELSDLSKFKDGRWMSVNRGVFVHALVQGEQIFKLPQLPVGPVYLTEGAVAVLQSSGITGFMPRGGGLWQLPLTTDEEPA